MDYFEEKNYNAINIIAGSDYRKIDKLKQENDSWTNILGKLKNNINPEEKWADLENEGVRLILKENPEYPSLLEEISWVPFGLYIKGSLPKGKAVGIVGTRKATSIGRDFARKIAKELSSAGITIVSGLAMGIDESAHQGALDAGGKTVAVMPTGLNKIYPAQNINLAKNIIDRGGALISEYPFNSPTYPANFIQRNRIISGLSLAVIVIEAPEKSGALATARFALEQNREIFVAPGQVNHPNYKGSHQLIRSGARIITSAEEVLEDLNIEYNKQDHQAAEISGEEKEIFEIIKQIGWPAPIDKISQKTKIGIQKINQIITFLTIKGLIK
ncbi:MAG: DNA-processing protein DprA [Candidatus Pacebacteria bacterium]|nr:DNA-processing protein DprA [Candidatus Paceibacterota bacterium]